jgi:hypothetical protein
MVPLSGGLSPIETIFHFIRCHVIDKDEGQFLLLTILLDS